jgi:heterodisulfide reductase subunit C
MDYPPHGVFRLVQLGLRREALECSTIWICVSCNTCSIQCPMRIDIPAIMDALRHLAIDEGVRVAEPDIRAFHEEVLNSIERYGRTHKLEIMLRYKARIHQWFADLDVGLKMLASRKLDLRPSRVKAIEKISGLFNRPRK